MPLPYTPAFGLLKPVSPELALPSVLGQVATSQGLWFNKGEGSKPLPGADLGKLVGGFPLHNILY